MAITVLRVCAAVGLALNLFLVIRKISSELKTEAGKEKWAESKKYVIYNAIVGVAANFLDVFGIGTYATTSAAVKFGKSVKDGDIPGTLSVGATIPVCIEAILFSRLVDIDSLTLALMVVAATAGALIGASLVTKLNIQGVRLMMGIGMIILGILMALRVFAVGPFGLTGEDLKLTGIKLVAAVLVQFILGIFMNIGVGLYAPCMALCTGLGLGVTAAFPIMMGSSAILMAYGSSPQFIKAGRFDMLASICQMIGGTAGVLVAYFLVKNLDVRILTIIISVVVLATGVMFFRDYKNGKPRRRQER